MIQKSRESHRVISEAYKIMFTNKYHRRRTRPAFRILPTVAILLAAFVLGGNAQTTDQNKAGSALAQEDPPIPTVKSKPVLMPAMENYKDVRIGSTAYEVREKLGKAKIDDKDGFYYRFNDDEFAQIRLDKNNTVKLMSITYSGNNKTTPTYADVFGSDAAATSAKPDGSIYKLVRYPQSGYWVAYSRTAGNDPSVTVTMQRIGALK